MKLPTPGLPLRALTLAVTSGCVGGGAESSLIAQEPQSYTLTSGAVSIYNLAGITEIVSHAGANVVVEVRTAGADGGSLQVVIDEIGGRESLRVRYPNEDVHYAAGSGRNRIDLRVASDGTFQRGGFFGLIGRGVNVSTYRGDLEAWADLRVLVPEGRDVEVHVGLGEMFVEGVRGTLRLDTRGGAVRTAGTVGRLAVSTGSGSIEVRGAEGTIDLDTGSGAIRVSDVTGSSLGMDTGSGSVEADNLTVDRLNVDTGSGRVRISAIAAADVMVDTGSGSVTLGLLRDVDQLDVETGSGRVEISVPATLGADVSVSTGSGRIDTEIPLQLRTARRNRLEGTFGDGAGRIRISTGSGGVGIREN